MEATTRDLRLHTAEVLAAADRGERVVITYRGRSRAVLTRWEGAERAAGAARNPAFGLWCDSGEAVDDQIRRLRQGRELP
ncbi:type II toxin-antitoxin system prevent-host-death family antitoxin [Pseudothauera nasutitermitis]|uniref:Type II toxin-antitoxin system prevent-host-death family antitoxin n=1 Tax=Pseudothauera nasutitermitis TaxID=2565930 RepID=A0A4S4ATS3_9RHOO|nr:type II toxin-antitoxin system prevent-host-death family antitoxin [Pseudothauera nasutitermitis]THF63140.1 type II toxin-antitoxin system prevent-host-death family antitoxin [Pseudothauera nasutitermitis]